MGKIDTKGNLKGAVGPIYYRLYNGDKIVQTKPGKGGVKQTAATKGSASDFGRASSLAKAIRKSLFPVLQNHSDSAFYRRFTALVNAATQANNPQPKGSRSLIEGNLSLLTSIDCNSASPFSSYCTLIPEASLSAARELTIALPEFNVLEQIVKPEDASHATLAFLVTAINPETNLETHAELFQLDMQLNNNLIAAQQWTTAALSENQLVVVTTALFYYKNNRLAGLVALNGKDFHPCEVSGVMRT